MKIKEVIRELENLAPGIYQESYDNSGLIVGDPDMEFMGSLVCLDSTEEVIDEAIETGANLVIAHHPILFKGLKRLNGKHYTERAVMKAIKHDIAIYAIHTNLDNVRQGVNEEIADRIGLVSAQREILIPKRDLLYKLEVLCPSTSSVSIQEALWDAGAGRIGDYERCAFESNGLGHFKPLEKATPSIGTIGQDENVEETLLQLLVPEHCRSKVLQAMFQSHPYEEVAYFLTKMENLDVTRGSGLVGDLEKPLSTAAFLGHVKKVMKAGAVKYTHYNSNDIKKVAVLGGSGIFGLEAAKRSGAQAFITSDVKYHEYFEADGDILLVDIGHYESEQYTQDLIQRVLHEKFPTFAHLLTRHKTNPVNYL